MMQYGHIYTVFCIIIKLKVMFWKLYTRKYFNVGTFNLLKSYDKMHGMTYTTKIMLSGIAKIKTGYFDNINDYY